MKTISAEEFKKKYGTQGLSLFREPEKKSSGYSQRVKESASQGLKQAGAGLKEVGNDRSFGPRLFEGALKGAAGVVNTVFSPISAAIEPAVKPAVDYLADKISDVPAVQKFATSKAGETTSRVVEDISNLNTIAGAVMGPKLAAKIRTGAQGRIPSIIRSSGPEPPDGGGGGGGQFGAVGDMAGSFIDEVRRIPSRMATNVAEKQVIRETIKTLPTATARNAALDGLDVADIKYLYKIPALQKAPLSKLAGIVKDFAEGKKTTNPIEVVGRPILNRIKQLESARGKIGQQLGEVADSLGVVTSKEAMPKIFGSLTKVPGLSGLTISKKGVLDFTDTVLTTYATAADRAAIQKMFLDAIRTGTGKSKHLLRQELFEILGGKKRALTSLTDTQEKAYNAVRQGLSDILEGKNDAYKNLSNQYRQVVQPLQSIRKFMKNVAGASEDILDMQAGLLARRLTSFAVSNPELRSILRAMDRATQVQGKSLVSVEALQDFYNILEKYYDIAPKTGYQAQIRQGVEKAVGGPINYIAEQMKGFAGETPIVRQKALERILEEIFNK